MTFYAMPGEATGMMMRAGIILAAAATLLGGCSSYSGNSAHAVSADSTAGSVSPVVNDTEATRSRVSPDNAASDPANDLIARIAGDTEDVWAALFKAMGASRYPYPEIVVFAGNVHSGCGIVSAAMGPFYCPGDWKVYLDSTFLGNLFLSVGAPGDFSQAYLIAHEVGHHVQNVVGTMRQFDSQVSRAGEQQHERLRVRLELQADYYTGVWVHFVEKRSLLEPGDLEKGLPAALGFGDARRHGTTEQRMSWFERGRATGDPRQCDTFVTGQP